MKNVPLTKENLKFENTVIYVGPECSYLTKGKEYEIRSLQTGSTPVGIIDDGGKKTFCIIDCWEVKAPAVVLKDGVVSMDLNRVKDFYFQASGEMREHMEAMLLPLDVSRWSLYARLQTPSDINKVISEMNGVDGPTISGEIDSDLKAFINASTLASILNKDDDSAEDDQMYMVVVEKGEAVCKEWPINGDYPIGLVFSKKEDAEFAARQFPYLYRHILSSTSQEDEDALYEKTAVEAMLA